MTQEIIKFDNQMLLPIRAFTRKLLNSVLPGDSEFTAFVIDYFPEVMEKFGIGQSRIDKTNTLLLSIDSEKICEQLKLAHPERCSIIETNQIKKHIIRNLSIAYDASDNELWTIKFKGEFGSLNWNDAQKIVERLRMLFGDSGEAHIALSDINPGSIELIFLSSRDVYKILRKKIRKLAMLDSLRIVKISKLSASKALLDSLMNSFWRQSSEDALLDAYLLNRHLEQKDKLNILQGVLESRKEAVLIQKIIYSIGVLGVTAAGKTSVVSKLVYPRLVDIEKVHATVTTEVSERAMAVYCDNEHGLYQEHILRFKNWPGECGVQAINSMTALVQENNLEVAQETSPRVINRPGVEALIIVVDLGDEVKSRFSESRIRTQLEYFNDTYFRFLLNDHILSYLQIIILFINKFDLLAGFEQSHDKMLERATELYKPLIQTLKKHSYRIPVHVVVGSALSDMGLVQLSSLLTTAMLPSSVLGPSPFWDVVSDDEVIGQDTI